jgi:hypothetical protein
MPTLVNPQEAAVLWYQAIIGSNPQQLPYSLHPQHCVDFSQDWHNTIAFGGCQLDPGYALLGISDEGVGYFHLLNLYINYWLVSPQTYCQDVPGYDAAGNPTTYLVADAHDPVIVPFAVRIYDYVPPNLPSDVTQLDGTIIVPHTRYPVVAAVEISLANSSTGVWYAFAAGDSLSLDVDGAEAGIGLINQGPAIDITLT